MRKLEQANQKGARMINYFPEKKQPKNETAELRTSDLWRIL